VSTYTRTFTESVQNEVEVIVEGAATEDEARGFADDYVTLGEGKYRVSGTRDAFVTINVTCEDSELEARDDEGEWEPDEDEDQS
jgi:hypothetical protein